MGQYSYHGNVVKGGLHFFTFLCGIKDFTHPWPAVYYTKQQNMFTYKVLKLLIQQPLTQTLLVSTIHVSTLRGHHQGITRAYIYIYAIMCFSNLIKYQKLKN
jgi:hypothetical protein